MINQSLINIGTMISETMIKQRRTIGVDRVQVVEGRVRWGEPAGKVTSIIAGMRDRAVRQRRDNDRVSIYPEMSPMTVRL